MLFIFLIVLECFSCILKSGVFVTDNIYMHFDTMGKAFLMVIEGKF